MYFPFQVQKFKVVVSKDPKLTNLDRKQAYNKKDIGVSRQTLKSHQQEGSSSLNRYITKCPVISKTVHFFK